MKEKLNEFKKQCFLFLKSKTSTVTMQLTIGISLIVFSSTLIIGLVFLSQYRQLSLKQTENELREKSYQLAELGNVVLMPQWLMPKERLFNSLKGITDSDFWIISNNGQIIVSTTNISMPTTLYELNDKFLNSIQINDSIITYEYTTFFQTKTLTVITPIVDDHYIIGAVILHKNVNVIYGSYTSFAILIFVSICISLALSIMLGILYSNYFTRPLKRITEVANDISNHNYDVKTNLKREDELGELASTIDTMSTEISKNIEEIKALEGRAKELVANVSHEFKTPLTLIRGYVENLKDKTTKPSKEIYEKIINNTITLEKLVNELLDLSKFQSGNVILKKESLELKQLIIDTVNDMKNIAKNKKIKIKIKDEYKLKQIIEADYIKVKQLLTIFLDNAIKYSNENSTVIISIIKGEIIISDEGVGMEQNELEQLFERYYQVNNNEKGYGLGLCIAKYIADAHNYSIRINSEPGKGTSVHLIF